MSAAASDVGSRLPASCAKKLAQPSRLFAGLLLFIVATIPAWLHLPAFADQQEAFLKVHQGRAALVRGQYLDAERLLTGALESGGLAAANHAFVLGDRGVARWRLGRLRVALDDFNGALRLAPEEATLYNNRGNVLLELELYAEAAKDFGQAMTLVPSYGAAYNNRGNTQYLLGNYAAALADFSKAIALMPSDAVPFNGRGKTQLALGRPAGANRDLSRAITLSPRYAQAYANRGEALAALRRYKNAVSDFSSAIEFGLKTAQVYLGRAQANTRLNKPGLALEDFAEARERKPSLTKNLAGQGAASDMTGRPEEAKAHLARAPASEPVTPKILPCKDTEGLAYNQSRQELPKVADALHGSVSSSLLVQASGEVRVSAGDGGPVGAKHESAIPCDTQGKQAPPVATEMEGWNVERTSRGKYVATVSEHPAVRLTLEMYGGGEPELLNWQPLKSGLRGIGLLHYYAGSSPEGERLEYVAMVDTKFGRLIAIEPARWGERQAKWTWSDLDVVVVDPQGVPSRVQLRDRGDYERPSRPQRVKVKRIRPPAPSVERRWQRPWQRARRNPYDYAPWLLR